MCIKEVGGGKCCYKSKKKPLKLYLTLSLRENWRECTLSRAMLTREKEACIIGEAGNGPIVGTTILINAKFTAK